jgi:hypothetical protein
MAAHGRLTYAQHPAKILTSPRAGRINTNHLADTLPPGGIAADENIPGKACLCQEQKEFDKPVPLDMKGGRIFSAPIEPLDDPLKRGLAGGRMPIRAQIPTLKTPPIAPLKFLDRFDIKAEPEALIKAADWIWEFGDPEFGIRRNDEKLSGLGNESPTGEFDFFRARHHKKSRGFAKSHLRNLLRLVTALHTKAALHKIVIKLTIASAQISQELLQQMVLFRSRWTPVLGNKGQLSSPHGQPLPLGYRATLSKWLRSRGGCD